MKKQIKQNSNAKVRYHALKIKKLSGFVKLGCRFLKIEWQCIVSSINQFKL